MGRKIFMSFLGTNKYMECNYYEEKNESVKIENVRFIQEALIRLYCKDFGENDRIFIFLTDKARSLNWDDGGNFEKGLKMRLEELGTRAIIEDVSYDENNILDIFKKMYETLEEEDEIIFDVTHSFRYTPMMAIVMFNYAKFLKNVKLRAIHYGAFERLGNWKDVEKIPVKERNAPIIDLSVFDELQQWSAGADNFVNYGNAEKIIKLINEEIDKLVKIERYDLKEILKKFKDRLDDFYKMIIVNNLPEINNGKIIKNLKDEIRKVKESNQEFRVLLNPIIDKIQYKVSFSDKFDILNGFRAVKWCIKHKMLQQGITILQENVVNYIIEQYNYNVEDKFLLREDIIGVMNVKAGESPDKTKVRANYEEIAHDLYDKLSFKLCISFKNLTEIRNNINHANTKNKNKQTANKYFKKVESTLNVEFENILNSLNIKLEN